MVHGAARPRRDTTSVSELRIRPAARAVILDPSDRILLVRFEFPTRIVWATPGGGIEPGETAEDALRRELEEEAGLTDFELGPLVWTRLHIIPFIGGKWDGQREQYHLVRTPAFEPQPASPGISSTVSSCSGCVGGLCPSSRRRRRRRSSLRAASPSSCDRCSATARPPSHSTSASSPGPPRTGRPPSPSRSRCRSSRASRRPSLRAAPSRGARGRRASRRPRA